MTSLDILEKDQVVFPKLGIDFSIDDTAFTIFGLDIKWYGLLITLGMLLAMIYCFSQMKKYGIDPDRAIDVVIGGVLGALVGARVYYVIMSWEDYAGDWSAIFNIRNGGLAIYGGIIGAILVGALIAKFRKVKLLPLLDIASIGFLLGQGIGRWGNFTNQEAFGCNTDSVFGMSSGKIQQWISVHGDSATLASGQTLDPLQPVHPCFLYESLWCLLGFVLLVIFARKIRKFDGEIFLIYLAWYGFERFFIEGLRTDSLMIGSLRVSQALAALCFVVSVILIIVFSLKVRRMGSDYVLYCDTEESRQLIREGEEKRSRTDEQPEKVAEENTDKPEESAGTAEETAEAKADNNDSDDKDSNENEEDI
ncbi:MAG: prolipoprotein diacylglyceryl transferase [Porcipelethomonas sp.]